MAKKQVVLGKGEKERREIRKEKRKRKKKGRKKEKEKEKEKEREKKGGGSKQIKKQNKTKQNKNKKQKTTGEYLLILYTVSPLTSPGTCPSSWSSGGRACCADFQALVLGGAAQPPAWCRAL